MTTKAATRISTPTDHLAQPVETVADEYLE